ncbi:MAG: TIGR00303 family protein [Synergistaceae bacterium]|jgi:uncharacterized protein (TIGR00303 family)|nr:TIGR00303 family protein [Synergistaceae bacterium]
MFFLFISNTDLAAEPGLSAAGANAEVLPLTSAADADVIRFGHPRAIDRFPADPEGRPTPAVITRAAVVSADIPVAVVRAGSILPPEPPYVELGASVGKDPRKGPSVPDARKIFERARDLARNLAPRGGKIMPAESVPGGTTTALLVLRALGHDVMVSSASKVNPIGRKEKIWADASARAGIKMGDLRDDPIKALEELGDPMQPAVLGFIAGSRDESEIVLAGGTQMLAVAACLRALGDDRPITVATTKYIVQDSSSSFASLASAIEVETYAAPLDFSASPFKGLRDYEDGYVKEGVGAGGSVLYAAWNGVGVSEVIRATNSIYGEIAASQIK